MQANEETEGCLSGNGCGEGKGHKRGRHIDSVTLRQRARHSRGPFAGLLTLPASPAPFGRGSYCASVREPCSRPSACPQTVPRTLFGCPSRGRAWCHYYFIIIRQPPRTHPRRTTCAHAVRAACGCCPIRQKTADTRSILNKEEIARVINCRYKISTKGIQKSDINVTKLRCKQRYIICVCDAQADRNN